MKAPHVPISSITMAKPKGSSRDTYVSGTLIRVCSMAPVSAEIPCNKCKFHSFISLVHIPNHKVIISLKNNIVRFEQ